MRIVFNIICAVGFVLLCVSAYRATSAPDAWENEAGWNLLGAAFVAAVCVGTNIYWRR